MDQQWASFDNPANRQARYAPNTLPSQPNTQRDANNVGNAMRQDEYTPSSLANRTPTMPLAAPTAPHLRQDFAGDGDGDVAMEDVDQYRPKQSARPTHSRQISQQQILNEESSAARRYSPMNLSPASPYNATPANAMSTVYNSYSPNTQARSSPTRQNAYISSPPTQNFYSPPCTHISVGAVYSWPSRFSTNIMQHLDRMLLNFLRFSQPSVPVIIILNPLHCICLPTDEMRLLRDMRIHQDHNSLQAKVLYQSLRNVSMLRI